MLVSALTRLSILPSFAGGTYPYGPVWPHLGAPQPNPTVVAVACRFAAPSNYPAYRQGMSAGVREGDVPAHVPGLVDA